MTGAGAPAGDSAAEASPRPRIKGDPTLVELTRPQRAVARLMTKSKTTVPHFYVAVEVDTTRIAELRERLRDAAGQEGPPPSFTDIVVKAAALALKAFPRVNGAYVEEHVELYPRINIAIAVAAAESVITPTIHDADQARLDEIARRNRELAGKVRDGTIAPAELDGATFTVSNLGMFEIDRFAAVITPPQAASLAVGRIRQTPVVAETGEIVARPQLTLTLSCDHRVLTGAQAAAFLTRVQELLESPEPLSG